MENEIKIDLVSQYLSNALDNNFKMMIVLDGNLVIGKPYTSENKDGNFISQLQNLSDDAQNYHDSEIGFNLKEVTLYSGNAEIKLTHLFICYEKISGVSLAPENQ